MSSEAYTPIEALRDQLVRVRLWLQRHRIAYVERDEHPDPRSRHMYVSEAEFGLLSQTASRPDDPALEEIAKQIERFEDQVQERLETTMLQERSVPLEDLRAVFRMDDEELDIIVALAAAEVDSRVARAYTNAWCDFTRKQPDVAFILELLSTDFESGQALREYFMPESTLIQNQLVQLAEVQRWKPDTPLIHQEARLSDRLVDFLTTGLRDRIDPVLEGVARLRTKWLSLDELLLPQEVKDIFLLLLRAQAKLRDQPLRVALLGPQGCGRRSLAAAVLAQAGRRLLVLDARRVSTEPRELVNTLRIARRDARIAQADLVLDTTSSSWILDLPLESRLAFGDFLESCTDPFHVVSDIAPEWLPAHNFVTIQIPFPTFEVQEALWRRHLVGAAELEEGLSLDSLVSSYSLSGGSIEKAAAEAIHRTRISTRAPRPVIARDTMLAAAQSQTSHKLGLLSEKVTRSLTWDDLVLSERVLRSLRDLVDQYRHQNHVFNEWGFRSKVAYGRGLSALFHGPPGTGKTMVAGIIARELGLEIYKIDLSRVVDKFIGETEKNLGRIFDEASRSNAILLFDEADSLFSKRTTVKSSHDRYANLETNYLLQRIESFDGVCMLTTNFESSIDDAFKRRLRFKIAFPAPNAEERVLLWQRMLPDQADVDEDIDFDELAKTYEMTGGNIKNAVLRGAFMAARNKTAINNQTLSDAARDEYREMGKLVRD